MLQPQDTTAIPELTRQVAHAAFPAGSLAIILLITSAPSSPMPILPTSIPPGPTGG